MENDFNPTEAGFAPIDCTENQNQNASGAEENKTSTNQIFKFNAAKKAFAKAGLAFFLLFLSVQIIGSLIAAVCTGIQLVSEIVSGEIAIEGLDALLEQGDTVNPEELYEAIMKVYDELLEKASSALIAWSVVATAIAMPIGILIERAVLNKVPANPIEKKNLSFSGYLFLLIVSLGLWGAGAIIGNVPSIFGLWSPLDNMMPTEGIAGVFTLIYAVIGAPLFEELACRKLLIDKLHGYGEVPAAFFSAMLFALLHANSTQFALAFTVGLAFAVVYLRTGNILYTMSFHAIINVIGSITSAAEICGAGDELMNVLGIGTYALLAVFAIAGITIAVIKRKSPLLRLSRPDFVGCNKIVYRNAGFILFFIFSTLTVLEIDFMTFLMNFINLSSFSVDTVLALAEGRITTNPMAFIAFIPTVIFFASIVSVMKTVGKKNTADTEIQPAAVSDGPQNL